MEQEQLLQELAARAREAGVFADVTLEAGELRCVARDVDADVWYVVRPASDARLCVGLETPDRWLSESIETDLVHTGDDLQELLDEELVEQGVEGLVLKVEHFRDDQRRFVFRSLLPAGQGCQTVACTLLAYEACFRELGDMSPEQDL